LDHQIDAKYAIFPLVFDI